MRNLFVAIVLFCAGSASAHHSYAMFDGARSLTVSGTVAKLEWMNPHVFIWVYVPNPQAKDGYDLYAFENGSPNVLIRLGWTPKTLAVGDKISVDYSPLKDGRNGGHFIRATLPNGTVMRGAGGPNAAEQGDNVPTGPGASEHKP